MADLKLGQRRSVERSQRKTLDAFTLIWVLLLSLVALYALSTLSISMPRPTKTYMWSDRGKSIALDVGATFRVRLPYAPSTVLPGSSIWLVDSPDSAVPPWQGPRPASTDSVLEFDNIQTDCKHDFQGFPDDCHWATYTFRGTGKGHTQLRMTYTTANGGLTDTFMLNVTVK